uniref:Predicted protein n=1 Tax=Hordeum vulgare subsp. vulgare TaxID=112509 RepID=F2DDD4_HORVV|nr:predicted protein [Hordeum vulgare subsp. vulgare]
MVGGRARELAARIELSLRRPPLLGSTSMHEAYGASVRWGIEASWSEIYVYLSFFFLSLSLFSRHVN